MSLVYERYAESAVFLNCSEQVLFTLAKRYVKHRYLSYLPKDKTTPILDVGCGHGRFVKLLREEGYTAVHGIDMSQDQIAYGKEKLGLHSCIEQIDAMLFLSKIEPNTYGAILILDVLEHLDMQTSIDMLCLCYRALRKEGVILIQTPNGLAPLAPQMFDDITHQRCYTSHSINQTLRLAGFQYFSVYPQPPLVHGIKSFVRRLLWDGILNPLICCYMLIASGALMGGVYTPNLLAVAKK